MVNGHIVRRILPRFSARWATGLGVLAAAVIGLRTVQWGRTVPALDLLALGPEGHFADTVDLPASWADTVRAASHDVVARFPLILGIRNGGTAPMVPGRLDLSLPLRYRLAWADSRELTGWTDPGSPIVTYHLDPGIRSVFPQRLPTLLPDTLWLEVLIPSYYCVAVGDSVPEFVPAPPPAVAALANTRIFYSFTDGNSRKRRTGTLTLRLDTTLLRVAPPSPPPSFPVETGAAAHPELGALTYVGYRRARCGAPEDPIVLFTSVWATLAGGRFYVVDYGGRPRKYLFDFDGNGIIDRESWDANGDGRFDTTRRMSMPLPDFLVPVPVSAPVSPDTTAADSLGAVYGADTTRALGPRLPVPTPPAWMAPDRAPVPPPARDTGAAASPQPKPAAAPARPKPDSLAPKPPEPLGRPVRPDSGGGGGT